MQPVVIVGTGHAGYTAAREFRKHDTTTPLVMVTADDGTSYTKPMLSNAMARGKTPAELAQASAEEMGEQLDARMITHARVTSIDAADRRLHLNDGGELEAAKIVLGIGANQIDPHLPGDGADAVLAVNDLDSYTRAREALEHARRVVLIGGGLIGCEFANDWVNAGYDVTIIEALDYPMGRMLPPKAGAALCSALTEAGVDVVTGRRVTAVERDDDALVVVDDAGDRHAADVAVRALGLRPRTRLAEEAGIEIGQGIRTDRQLETSASGIYALGDCAEVDGLVLPFVMPITHAARALGATLAGTDTEVQYPVMPVIVKTPCCPIQFYAPPIGVAGEWQEQEDDNGGTSGLFVDREGRARGFVLTGPAVARKAEMVKQVPGWFDNRD
ncbi:MAG: NAD(P)/FAD-dependent oxidoreductase [Halofilum sp. (in: g-proteobacteria)]